MSEQNTEINYEAEARGQGWVPREEFRGGDNEWVDAQEFVERGRQILPILRANYERLKKESEKERETHRRELDEIRKTAEEFKKFQKEAYDRKAAEFDQQLQSLREEKKRAIADGDGDRVVAIDDQMDDIKEQKRSAKEESKEAPPAQAQNVPQMDETLKSWLDKHSSWYGVNRRATSLANAIAEEVKEQNPHLTGKAFLDAVDAALENDEDVAKYTGKQRRQSPVDSGTTNRSVGGKKKSYDNLPPDAKAACDKYVSQKLMTKEEYVEAYDWS